MEFKKPRMLAAVGAIAIAVIVVSYVLVLGASPTVASGDSISVYYTGKYTNGTVFNSNEGGIPFNFTVGAGQVISGFNNGVIGMSVGQTRTITIPANQAYGEINPALIIDVPVAAFGNRSIAAGMGLTETINGTQRNGIITSVNSTIAVIDFNPPLAGKTLVFNITVVSIRKPKQQ